jgi:hypothetical protein
MSAMLVTPGKTYCLPPLTNYDGKIPSLEDMPRLK